MIARNDINIEYVYCNNISQKDTSNASLDPILMIWVSIIISIIYSRGEYSHIFLWISMIDVDGWVWKASIQMKKYKYTLKNAIWCWVIVLRGISTKIFSKLKKSDIRRQIIQDFEYNMCIAREADGAP